MDIRIGDRFKARNNLLVVGDVLEVTKHVGGNVWYATRLSDGTVEDFLFGGGYVHHDVDWEFLGNYRKSDNYVNLFDLLNS